MKIESKSKKDNLKLIQGVNSVQMGVTVNSKMFELMSDNIYSNVPNAIMRELISNAIDASVLLPTELQKPISVHIPENLGQDLFVQDFGKGMSIETVLEVFANYFSSTKENDEKQIGGFGLGSKTPFAYVEERGFRVETTSPDDGVRRTFIFKRVPDKFGNKFPNYQHMDDLDIENSSIKGTKISFELKNEKDIELFMLACLQMKWSSYPIEYSGKRFEDFLKEDKKLLKDILSDLKNNGYIVYNQSHKIFDDFDCGNLMVRNSQIVPTGLTNNSNQLILLLGGVIYLHDKFDYTAKEMIDGMAKQMGVKNPKICLSIQNNGYITLNASRENVRENQVNSERLNYLLKKALFDFTQKYSNHIIGKFQEENNEQIPNYDSFVHYLKKINGIQNALTQIKSVRKYLEHDVSIVDDETKHFDLSVLDEHIEKFEQIRKKENDFWLNFFKNKVINLKSNEIVSAEEIVQILETNISTNNLDSILVLIKDKAFDKYDEKNPKFKDFLVSEVAEQLLFFIEDKDVAKFFNTECFDHFNPLLKKTWHEFQDFEKKQNAQKELKSHILNMQRKIDPKNESKYYRQNSKSLTLPKEYVIEDIKNPSEMDKVMLLIYHSFVDFKEYNDLPVFQNTFNNELKGLKDLSCQIKEKLLNGDRANDFFSRYVDWSDSSEIKRKTNTLIKRFMVNLCDVLWTEYNRQKGEGVFLKAPDKMLLQQDVNKTMLENCKKEIKSKLIEEVDKLLFSEDTRRLPSIPKVGIKQHLLGFKGSHDVITEYFDEKYNLINNFVNDFVQDNKDKEKKTIENNLLYIKENGLEPYFKENSKLFVIKNKFNPLLDILYNLKKLSESKVMTFEFEQRPNNIQWIENEVSEDVSKEKIQQYCHKAVQKEIEHIITPINKGIILLSKIAECQNKKAIEKQK